MEEPLVSAIIPTKNRPKLLNRAVSSVQCQTYSNIEVIIVYDSPTDLVHIESGDAIRCIQDQSGSPSSARNTGAAAASGKYIGFLDDDDEWLPEKTWEQVRLLERRSGNVAAYCGVKQVDENEHVNAVKRPEVSGRDLFLAHKLGTLSALMIRRELFLELGGLDADFVHWEDWDLHLRLQGSGSLVGTDQPLVRRNSGSHEQLSDGVVATRRKAGERLLEKHQDSALEEWGSLRPFRSGIEYEVARAAFHVDDYSAAQRALGRACYYYPFRFRPWLLLLAVLGGKSTFNTVRRFKRWVVRKRYYESTIDKLQ